jgi:hypothetical protein
MGLSHRFLGAIGLATMCGCLLTVRGVASEVTGILSDLDGDFRNVARQLTGYQTRLGHLEARLPQLGAELSPTRAVAGLDEVGSGASRTLVELRSRLEKVREILPALREKFPEDLTQVESYFSGWMTLQARAEDDYAGLRCRLDSVRDQVSQRLLRTVNPAARATLLDAVRERLMVRDAALSAVRAEPPASEPAAAPVAPSRPVALQPTLGHPPRRPRAPKPRVERSRPGPPARPAGAPDAAGSERGSVTVDLEQLIQEMDSQ